ncbi:DUF3052 domain-containing protein [Algoriphagus sp.]|uniref:DUF3052 domain-containing protein n=1 Tax=Algoriphagus sp. TaxID=1872435 RepID=UPI0025E56B66|nr:DUF3052 domain-containing protein [Algoriphagus sp.]
MENPGYSGTPLAKKLGIKSGMLVQILFCPKDYLAFFHDFPENVSVETGSDFSKEADLIHLFVRTTEELEIGFNHALSQLKKSGSLWVSWPKKTSGIPTKVDKFPIRSYGLEKGFVDVKVAAIDDQWSGLKFMYRLKDR